MSSDRALAAESANRDKPDVAANGEALEVGVPEELILGFLFALAADVDTVLLLSVRPPMKSITLEMFEVLGKRTDSLGRGAVSAPTVTVDTFVVA